MAKKQKKIEEKIEIPNSIKVELDKDTITIIGNNTSIKKKKIR